MILTRRDIDELLRRHGLSPSRALGQHFVVDPNTVRRIARLASVGPGDSVVEVGAGLGSLTLALSETGASVTALEVDRHLLPALHEVVDPLGVTVVEADAMTVEWESLLSGTPDWVLVANLPYNIATPLVLDLLDSVPRIARMLVMVQRELAERLTAAPGGGDYGVPSVKVAYWAEAHVVGSVSSRVFLPPPKVDSALVEVVRRPVPAVSADPDVLFGLVRAGFGQRRKMLRRSLSGRVAPEQFEAAGVRPDARPEELSVEEWGRLADTLAEA